MVRCEVSRLQGREEGSNPPPGIVVGDDLSHRIDASSCFVIGYRRCPAYGQFEFVDVVGVDQQRLVELRSRTGKFG